MTRDDSELSERPDRLIIVDADNPMTEIRGRFVWLEEHARAVEQTRLAAFADGFASAMQERPATLVLNRRRRRPPFRNAQVAIIILLVLFVLLVQPVVVS